MENGSLNTIRFYIILKLKDNPKAKGQGLNTIRFYIILKQQVNRCVYASV